VLVQVCVPFHVRFMMASAMRLPFFETFWEWAGIISVSTSGRDLSGVREALKHLASGGVVGIFPEGAIERPPRRLLAFMPGTSLLITKGKAPVLPIAIDGTPYTSTAWGSLFRTSRSRVRIGKPMTFPHGTPSQTIVNALETWFVTTLGWPIEAQTQVTQPSAFSTPRRAE
jgi:1-acyl-sn-glycerol-3-phosphate acyltransferase